MGTGGLDHGFQHLGRHHHRLARLARGAGDLLLPAGNASSGSSTPRSPRATISASASSRISASVSSALGFSILASTAGAAAHDLLQFGHVVGPLHERQRDPVHAQHAAPRRDRCGPWASSRRCGRSVSGMLTPLRSLISPPTSTMASAEFGFDRRRCAGAPCRRRSGGMLLLDRRENLRHAEWE